jgi:uncharacterized protein YndB with AHSA1/START domain
MLNVRLQETEWNQLISIIAQAPWSVANPLLTAITRQLQEQKTPARTNADGGTAAAEDAAVAPMGGRH